MNYRLTSSIQIFKKLLRVDEPYWQLLMIYWITGSYLLGSFAGYLIGRGRTQNTIEDVIDSLCEQGFLKHSQDPKTGEVEIKKWNSLD